MKQSHTRIRNLIAKSQSTHTSARVCLAIGAVVVLTFASTACGNGEPLALWFGLSDRQPPPPIVADLDCDQSRGAPCTQATLTEALSNILPVVAERPRSVIRIWMQGSAVTDTVLVAQATSPTTRKTGRRAVTGAAARWIAKTQTDILAAAAPYFASPARRSPIVETLTRVARASTGKDAERWLIVLTDGLEVSEFADFECRQMPSSNAFVRMLQRRAIFSTGTFRNIHVRMAHLDLRPIDHGRCRMTLARASEVREVWKAAFVAAGATDVAIGDGAPEINVPRVGKEETTPGL